LQKKLWSNDTPNGLLAQISKGQHIIIIHASAAEKMASFQMPFLYGSHDRLLVITITR
jgi:hypothetical protein